MKGKKENQPTKQKQGKEGIRTKKVVWDAYGFFVVQCAKPNKSYFFSMTENIAFSSGKSIGFPLLLLCSLNISCLVLWPQLIFRSLIRTDLFVQILPVLDILNLVVG